MFYEKIKISFVPTTERHPGTVYLFFICFRFIHSIRTEWWKKNADIENDQWEQIHHNKITCFKYKHGNEMEMIGEQRKLFVKCAYTAAP